MSGIISNDESMGGNVQMSTQMMVSEMLKGLFTTGNPVIDILLRSMMLTMVMNLINNLLNFNVTEKVDWVRNQIKPKNVPTVVMRAESIPISHGGKIVGSRMNYSDQFRAILDYIQSHPELKIHSVEETEAFNSKKDKDPYYCTRAENADRERSSLVNNKYFIPGNREKFMIAKSSRGNPIYCQVVMFPNKSAKELTENGGGGGGGGRGNMGDKKDEQRIHEIHLTMPNGGDRPSIHVFMDACLFDYNKKIDAQMNCKQFFFNYRRCTDNGDDEEIPEYDENPYATNKSEDTIFFEGKQAVLDQVRFFIENEQWYKRRGMPYHLGMLLYGTPGCGKTSLIKVIAAMTGYSIIVINLNRITKCSELEKIFYSDYINKKYIPSNRRIYVFEDIDCLSEIVQDRDAATLAKKSPASPANSDCDDDSDDESTTEETPRGKSATALDGAAMAKLAEVLNMATLKSMSTGNSGSGAENYLKSFMKDDNDKLNLACILNLLDGIVETPGRIVIMTSNYPERLDKALLRAGRVDLKIEFKKASRQIALEIISNFYEVAQEEITAIYDELLAQIPDYVHSPAEVSNQCIIHKLSLKGCLEALVA
jgi:ATPase family associated with various cellular activities (AAA)